MPSVNTKGQEARIVVMAGQEAPKVTRTRRKTQHGFSSTEVRIYYLPSPKVTRTSRKTPPEANPPAQSSSSTEAQTTDTLTNTTGNCIKHT